MNIQVIPQNIVEGINRLTQSAINTPDTIYIVRYDFEISEPVTLPYGCELRIEGGSISGGNINLTKVASSKIAQPQANDWAINEFYMQLTVAPTAEPYIVAGKLKYRTSGKVYLTDGCVLKSINDHDFYLYLNTSCRVMLPESPRGTLHIKSDKVNSIQIDGKCDFEIHAENCRFERIFANHWGWQFVNRLYNNIDHNIFENCMIWAKDFPLDKSLATDSNFHSLNVGINPGTSADASSRPATESINWLVLSNCVVDNLGISGSVNVDNCTFIFGRNTNDGYETIDCNKHSRITNCVFDGKSILKTDNQAADSSTPTDHEYLNGDVIHLRWNDCIIDGCTFIGYKNKDNVSCNLISVLFSYSAISTNKANERNGLIVTNCYFDLPAFEGDIIKVENYTPGTEDRDINKKFTLVEANYVDAPKAYSLVKCLTYTQNLTVKSNICRSKSVVMINNGVPVLNLVIDGNTSYAQPGDAAMAIVCGSLNGSLIDNIVISNNKVNGNLWGGMNIDTISRLKGVIRIYNNESVGDKLFKYDSTTPLKVTSSQKVFFSGNVSNDKKTDVGNMDIANSANDGILFTGRQFFCSEGANAGKLLVFNGSDWLVI